MSLGLVLAGCGGGETTGAEPTQTDGAPQVDLVNEGKLTTCTNLPYEPFQFEQEGEVVGFDVELIDLVAEKLGVEQEIVDIQFDVIKSGAALNANRCDVAAAAMTITPDRQENLDFSDPYFDEVLGIMTEKGSGIESIEDVQSQNLGLGVQAGTTSLDYAEEQGLDPKQFPDSGKQLQALRSGGVDVILQDLPVVNTWLDKPEIAADYELVNTVTTGAQYGFAVRKGGNPELLEVINETIAESKETGTYDEIYEKWFGSKPSPAAS